MYWYNEYTQENLIVDISKQVVIFDSVISSKDLFKKCTTWYPSSIEPKVFKKNLILIPLVKDCKDVEFDSFKSSATLGELIILFSN